MLVRVFKMLFVASQVAGSVFHLNTYLGRGVLNPPPQRAHWSPRTPLWRRSSCCESLLWETISHLQEPSTAHISLTFSTGVHIRERVGGEMWTVQVVWGKREEKYGKITLLWLRMYEYFLKRNFKKGSQTQWSCQRLGNYVEECSYYRVGRFLSSTALLSFVL